MSRCLAEMMPTVTEPPSPNGLPIAITQSPTRSLVGGAERHRRAAASSASPSAAARSVLVSLPSTLSTLSLVPSLKLTMISSAPSMTWLLVTTMPSLPSMTKPEPSEETLRSDGERPPLRLKKSSKNSSNGAPFGTLGSGTPSGPLRVWLVEMLTTASISFSATGATLVGPAHLRAGRRQHQHAGPPRRDRRAGQPAAASPAAQPARRCDAS